MLFPTVCPLFWRRFSTDQGVYCFKLNTDFLTWHEARDKCAEYGGDLVSIRGEEEADFVKNQVQLCGYVLHQKYPLLKLKNRTFHFKNDVEKQMTSLEKYGGIL